MLLLCVLAFQRHILARQRGFASFMAAWVAEAELSVPCGPCAMWSVCHMVSVPFSPCAMWSVCVA